MPVIPEAISVEVAPLVDLVSRLNVAGRSVEFARLLVGVMFNLNFISYQVYNNLDFRIGVYSIQFPLDNL